MPYILSFSLIVLLGSGLPAQAALPEFTLEAPGKQSRPSHTGNEMTLINGRRLTPAGEFVRTQSYSWGMAISPDEKLAVLMRANALEFISLETNTPKLLDRIPPYGEKPPAELSGGTYMGCAFSPDGKTLYISDANRSGIIRFKVAERKFDGHIPVDGNEYKDSLIGDMVVNRAGTKLYAVDQHNYRLIQVDLPTNKVRSERVGRNPFAVRLSHNEQFAWVSNVGMFEYQLIPGIKSGKDVQKEGLDFAPFGIPSKEAEGGVEIDGKKIPGLGSTNHPDAMSVFKVSLNTGNVAAKIKTGYLVGAKRGNINTVGGASPSTVAVAREYIYVANTTNDTISIIDAAKEKIVGQIELLVPHMETLRGVMPFGLALSPDESRLYVACSGLNAVAVVDTVERKNLGYIPAGWFCSFVKCSADGKRLFVSSAKGVGSGPNGGKDFTPPARGTHPGDIMQGTFQIIPVPSPTELTAYTQRVFDNTSKLSPIADNLKNPLPPVSKLRVSPIKHVVFIVKENRTFDQVFGARKNVAGDPTLATLALKVSLKNSKGLSIPDADITPNHQALADQFAICDNFYCDSDQSNTGHRWVAGVYPNEWVEVNARSRIEERLFSTAPGRRYVSGSSAIVNPEDYNEAGALWEHLHRNRIPFFNFGFGTEMPAALEEQVHKYTGVKMAVAFPLPKPLFDNTSRKFATYNTSIPDQFRVDMFEQEYAEKWGPGKQPLPALITMVLPNDHMAGERPEAGYPFKESYVADNDVALGRVVQFLSKTPYWKDMLIIVTEDDSQGGPDHMEAHRSLLMLIGPHVKKGYVSHTLLNFGSIIKTIFTILDLPYLNQFDAAASLPDDMFAELPDPKGYQLLKSDTRVFDPAKALKPFDRGFNWSSLLKSPKMDNPEDMRRNFLAGGDDDDDDDDDE
ncbi:MAG: bifunctional YncE family protein/alkaline phosphatase family protein [Planctomycetales bacterium]